jgi:DNA ligase-1
VHANDSNASDSKAAETANVSTQHSLAHSKVSKFVPDLLLLKEYVAGQNIDGWLMSEKLDGVRAYWNGKQLMSRNGNPFAVPDWFTENFPPFELDGELWLGRHQFEQTMSIVNTQTAHKGWRDLTFQIFELPNQSGGLLARLNILNLYLKQFPAPYLRIIEQVEVSDDSQLQAELQRVLALNGEGLVVRNPLSLYQTGRSNEALKVKLKQDAECQVKGYTPGKGKYLGNVGALKCEVMDGQFTDLTDPNDRLLKIGSGLSDLERAHPPKVGEIITFQYIGLTQKGLPRFAVFLRVRDDL